jgi:DNA-binding NtrC family response regulator
MIDLYRLKGTDETRVDNWIQSLGGAQVNSRPADKALWAVWTGRPFIVAGSTKAIDVWINCLDEHATVVLKDHAFFWILTNNGGYSHENLPTDRVSVLDWRREEQHIVRDALTVLKRFQHLAGFSRRMQHLREEIERIASGQIGPSSPVLILGESGSGKEGTAQSLVAASRRAGRPGLYAVSGASLRIDPGLALAELFGIEPDIATGVRERAGLVERYSEGALFIDDFDTAPILVQEQLLRITSTPKGQKAKYRRVGALEDRETNVWLLFATNSNIETMLEEKTLRVDFLFRFEDRVLMTRPLRERPADLPAISHRLWSQLLDASGLSLEDRPLPWRVLHDLQARSQKLRWEGNVRELAALLSLAVSMARMPRHRKHSTSVLVEQVLARGDNFKQWFGILAADFFTAAPQPISPEPIRQILAMDSGAGTAGLSPCELEIKEMLNDAQWGEIEDLVKNHFKSDHRRLRRSFCRYLAYVRRFNVITIKEAGSLGGVKYSQARKHLRWLAEGSAFLMGPQRISKSRLEYGPGKYL